MITAGIDCGAKNTKTAVLRDGAVAGTAMAATGYDLEKAAASSLAAAADAAAISPADIRMIFSTGSGRGAVTMAHETVSDIAAMGKGANFYFPDARTVADVGAEEGRAAKIDETGEVADFVVNEKCAAGAGTFIEIMAKVLETPMEEMGPLALTSGTPIAMNAQCTVFAEAEAVGLIHANTRKCDISRAVHDAVAGRIVSMIRRIGVDKEVVLLGGVGYNPAFLSAMKRELKLETIHVPEFPEYGAAVGAAVLAAAAMGP